MQENTAGFYPRKIREEKTGTLIIGSGAAGYQAALSLHRFGVRDFLLISEDLNAGTSRNTGSDKQTYYKLSLAGETPDSVRQMAKDLFAGGCVDGDTALAEAALSVKCFCRLCDAGVAFPENEYGESIGYRTDHDVRGRASSVGPYTSRKMTEALENEVRRCGIPVRDGMQAVRYFALEGKAAGVLCLDRQATAAEKDCLCFVLFRTDHIILATGGPAAMYADSVYPPSQFGSSGIAFLAGVKGRNLTEWQFGLASKCPRWNVSGSYMQAMPRFVSTDADGKNEKEFLTEYFRNPEELLYQVFLKGYQWPFDTAKCVSGSSRIDLIVYEETVRKGRRVYLDYTENPLGAIPDYGCLPAEAADYLSQANACLDMPIERLRALNEPAYRFYLDHGVDLKKDRLEIAVCAQHNNGGLAVDAHWQTNIRGIYAVGEAAGTHGVSRPGGSALNAGQVGALRAAEDIAFSPRGMPDEGKEKTIMEHLRGETEKATGCIARGNPEPAGRLWREAAERMSRAGGMIRNPEAMEQALSDTEQAIASFSALPLSGAERAGTFFHLYDMLLAQKVYLSAMTDYVRHGGKSRGSALYVTPDGTECPEGLPDYPFFLSMGELRDMVQEISLENGETGCFWRPVRPLPDAGLFFETEWKAFRERRGNTA